MKAIDPAPHSYSCNSPASDPCEGCPVREVGLSSDLTPEQMAKVDSYANHVEFAPEQALIFEGDEADRVYNITAGVIRVSRMSPDGRRAITGFIFPGDFLGLSYGGKFSYTAEAIGHVTACRFQKASLDRVFKDMPGLERKLLAMVSAELLGAQDQMMLLARKTPKEKVASFLLYISEKQSRNRAEPPASVALAMSRVDIADYLGLTVETVSRTFTVLSKQGLIALPSRREIELLDLEALQNLAESDND